MTMLNRGNNGDQRAKSMAGSVQDIDIDSEKDSEKKQMEFD